MLILVSALSLVAWAYLVFFHGSFWRSGPELEPGKAYEGVAVAVVVPARNEADSIRDSLGSLLRQEFAGRLSVILVDDNSTDRTREIAVSLETDERLSIVDGGPLPSGWTGKLWAVHQGLMLGQAKAADYVLLTDADIVHAPSHISTLVAKAQADGLDMVSEMVRLHCETAAEQALIPAFVFFFQMLYPFAWIANPSRSTAGAAGGTILVRRAALDRIDGVSRIRGRLIDDCALAKEIKSTGGRIWLGHASGTVSNRVYHGWREVWDMIARTAYVQLNYSPWLLLGCIAGMSILYAAPPMTALFGHGVSRVLGGLAWMMMALAFQPTLRRYRSSVLWGIALPAIALFYLGATVASAVRHSSGSGGEWKDRVYPGSTPH